MDELSFSKESSSIISSSVVSVFSEVVDVSVEVSPEVEEVLVCFV